MSDTENPPTDESTADDQRLPGEYDPSDVEPAWQDQWVTDGTYAYDESAAPRAADASGDEPRDDADTRFTIDTPPPTVSGNLHMGHLYQFTLQDFVARYRRMAENTVYFPFGYDDNGIASERLTERELDIRHQDFSRRE